MMHKCFKDDTLEVRVSRTREKTIIVSIHSDYAESERKMQLHVDTKALTKTVEETWKAIKTKMLLNASVSFDEIDWYDDLTNIYTTPIISIERGLRKAKIGYSEHGSIPKEWSIEWRCRIKDTNTILPVMDVITNVLGPKLTKEYDERIRKMIRPVLQSKKDSVAVPKILRA